MAERCLIDYCRADKKDRLLHVSYSDNEAFIRCLVHRCGIVKLQENAWQTVSLTIFREKIQNMLFIEATQISTEFLSAKDNISRDLSK